MSDETKKPEFELIDEGDDEGKVVRNRKGKATLLAVYEETDEVKENGDPVMCLTFESESIDARYRAQIIRAIIETSEGELTGNHIDVYAINGREPDKRKKGEPPAPKMDKMMGDKTPAFVRWLYKWRPQEFYARYQVLLDSTGEPRTAHCIRVEQGLVEPDNGKPLKVFGDGRDALTSTVLEDENGMLARRQTCLTFLPQEEVGRENEDPTDIE